MTGRLYRMTLQDGLPRGEIDRDEYIAEFGEEPPPDDGRTHCELRVIAVLDSGQKLVQAIQGECTSDILEELPHLWSDIVERFDQAEAQQQFSKGENDG